MNDPLDSPGSFQRLSQRRYSIRESLKAGALSIGEQDHVRSIGGRLGGHFDSIRSFQEVAAGEDDESVDEAALLLKPPPKKKLEKIESGVPAVEEEHMIPTHAPPLAVWIVPALSCAAAYAFYNIFIKKGSASINPILGGVILQFVAAVLGSFLLLVLVCCGEAGSELKYDKTGIQWSICAGLAVGIAEMLSFVVSGMGVPVTQSIPIIIGGSVMFGAVLGLLMLGEQMMCHGWSGVFLLMTGISLVATDPGDKVVEGAGTIVDEAPPLVMWIFPALTCASAYAFYNIFIKKGSASINPILGGVILQYVAALFGSILLGVIMLEGSTPLAFDEMGLIWSVCAGIAVGMAEMLSFCVSGMGVQATQSIPIIIGGSVMFGAVLGIILLAESLMFQGWSGVALLMTGIALVATDPGEKVAGH